MSACVRENELCDCGSHFYSCVISYKVAKYLHTGHAVCVSGFRTDVPTGRLSSSPGNMKMLSSHTADRCFREQYQSDSGR